MTHELDEKALKAAHTVAMEVFNGDVARYPLWRDHLDAIVDTAIRAYLSAAKSEPVAVKARWKHKKRGTTYTEVGRGILQVDADLDGEKVVIYRADKDGQLWVRPVYEFQDGRFEALASEPANG